MANDSRRGWLLRGRYGDLLIVHRRELTNEERDKALSPSAAVMRLQVASGDPAQRRALAEVHAALRGPSLLPRGSHGERHVLAVVEDAVRRGELAVLEQERRRVVVELEIAQDVLGPAPESEEEDLTWIGLELVDEAGEPLANRPFVLKLADGSTREGTLDGAGKARVNRIPPGPCKVSFVDIHGSEWEAA